MAPGYLITVDTPPFGVRSTPPASANLTAESVMGLLREGRTVYVSTPDGDLIPGDEFVAEVAQGRYD